jgi:hypothetical protein
MEFDEEYLKGFERKIGGLRSCLVNKKEESTLCEQKDGISKKGRQRRGAAGDAPRRFTQGVRSLNWTHVK